MALVNAFTEKLRRLAGLGEADVKALDTLCSPVKTFAAGRSVVAEGASVKHLHVVLDGWASRYRTLSDGRRQFPSLLLPGDVCDLDRLMIDRLHFGVMSLTPCSIAAMPLDKLRVLLEDSSALRNAFWWLTCVENSIANEWAVCLGRRSALERVAHLLCELKIRAEAVYASEADSYILPMTQEDLGDAVGLSVVHINRTLQTLRQRGLINLRDRRLTILDYKALVGLCDFSEAYLHMGGEKGGGPASRSSQAPAQPSTQA